MLKAISAFFFVLILSSFSLHQVYAQQADAKIGELWIPEKMLLNQPYLAIITLNDAANEHRIVILTASDSDAVKIPRTNNPSKFQHCDV